MARTDQSVYPLHRCKTLHLVTHAQAIHDVKEENKYKFTSLPEDLLDPYLSPLGWTQVDNLREHVQASGLSKRIELVITSPLLRTMQTAVGVFGGEAYTDGINAPPLMTENVGLSGRLAISSLNSPPFLAVELCREKLGGHLCNKRRSVSEYRNMFPAIDFSLMESDEDVCWPLIFKERNFKVTERGLEFLKWLWTRKEKEIAVVTHCGFLYHTLGDFGRDCHATVKSEISKDFAICELRSVVIVDRGKIGSDDHKSTTNYPGNIPRELDLPGDVADEKPAENLPAN